MLILSCQREILTMLSIGQTDMSVGHSVKNIMQPMLCLLSSRSGHLGWPRRYPFNWKSAISVKFNNFSHKSC